MWLLLGYPSKYRNYTSKKQFGQFPHSPRPPPTLWITFLPFISQNFLLNIKDVEFDFSMGCIPVLFSFLWIIDVQFTNFVFLNFRFLVFQKHDIGLLWSKITIFIIEITVKLLLHTKYGWNNPNWGRLSLKNSKLHFFAISGSSKFITCTNIQIHVTRPIIIVNWFFVVGNARNNILYQNQ